MDPLSRVRSFFVRHLLTRAFLKGRPAVAISRKRDFDTRDFRKGRMENKMKKLQALMVLTALALGTVTFASASDEKKHSEKEHKEKKDGHKKDDHKKKEKH
ncbi:MAG: hypothetical protein K2Q23_09920 [Bryobacteraceae bacterium]|nr:hypothetical protein [Bryobacteraceae bacterium]